MYKSLSILTITFLLIVSAFAQQKTDREKANLTGRVKTIRSEMVSYLGEELQEKGLTKKLDAVTYEETGNEVERIIYDDYGFLVGKEVRTFDAQGNLAESILSDEQGVVIERRVYSFDNNKLAQIISYDAEGKIGLKQVSSYDEDKRLKEETYFNSKIAVGKTVYKYNENGTVSEVAFYLADGSKAVAPIGPCLGAHKIIYAYKGNDKPSKVVAYEPNGKVKRSWQYSYNSKGLLFEDLRESNWSNLKFVYTYEYDSQGNWIKQTARAVSESKLSQIEPSERTTTISREIVYY